MLLITIKTVLKILVAISIRILSAYFQSINSNNAILNVSFSKLVEIGRNKAYECHPESSKKKTSTFFRGRYICMQCNDSSLGSYKESCQQICSMVSLVKSKHVKVGQHHGICTLKRLAGWTNMFKQPQKFYPQHTSLVEISHRWASSLCCLNMFLPSSPSILTHSPHPSSTLSTSKT